MWANGGSPDNPMGFPGYGNLYYGNDITYRWMLQHPVLRLVRAIDLAVIIASNWLYTPADSQVPDEWVEGTRQTMDRLRLRLMLDFFARGRDHGWAGGEIRWTAKKGFYDIECIKPLIPDITQILKDPETGDFDGLRNHIRSGDEPQVDIPAPYKAFLYTYDSDCGYLYGRSWLENLRATAWKDWLDCAQQLQKLGAKITAIMCVITSPAGTFPGPGGKPIRFQEAAEKIIKAFANGSAGAWIPSLGISPDSKGSLDALKIMKELLGKSLTNFELLDFGSTTPAIMGLLERMRHAEENMFAGGCRSSRTGMEAHKGGAKSDAEVHTDSGTMVAEMDDQDFAQKCQCLVDARNVINYGERARGRVILSAAPLVDRLTPIIRAFLLACMNDPAFVEQFAKAGDVDQAMKLIRFPTREKFDAAGMTKRIESNNTPLAKPKTPEPSGGRPPNDD